MLIVPEADLWTYQEYKNGEKVSCFVQPKPGRMERLKAVASNIWMNTAVLAVQTGRECSDMPPSAEEIAQGMEPQAEPFCIICGSFLRTEAETPGHWVYANLGRNGVLMERDEKSSAEEVAGIDQYTTYQCADSVRNRDMKRRDNNGIFTT